MPSLKICPTRSEARWLEERPFHFSLPKPESHFTCPECSVILDLPTPPSFSSSPCPTHSPAPRRIPPPPEDILYDSNWPEDVLHPNWERPTYYPDWVQREFDRICAHTLPGPGFYPLTRAEKIFLQLLDMGVHPNYIQPPLPLPSPLERQGTSQTNIYGNGNNVTTDLGANGWSPTVNTALGDGPVTSSPGQVPDKRGGSSTSKTQTPAASGGSSNVKIHNYKNWWEPIAQKALSRGVDKALDGIEGAGKLAHNAIKSKIHSNGSQDTRLLALPGSALSNPDPNTVQSGNFAIQSSSGYPTVTAYPPTPCVPLPNPDLPSYPGPAGDRTWLLDTFSWSASDGPRQFLGGSNSMTWGPLNGNLTFPFSDPSNWNTTGDSTNGAGYPLPASFVKAYPDSAWAAMYDTNALWNCGWQVTVVVNGCQFHGGALAIFAIPEGFDSTMSESRFWGAYTFPYVILNLFSGNAVTLDLPYIGPAPNAYSGLHCPWTIVSSVLTPLQPPTNGSNQLGVSIYVSPVNSSFHGLRMVARQHWKTRNVPGSGAFGNVVADQEISIDGVCPFSPPVDYLPGEGHDWMEFANRPGVFNIYNWTAGDDVGDNIATETGDSIALSALVIPLAFGTSLYTQGCGPLHLSLLFAGSSQHYGRLLVAYSPPGTAAPTTLQEASRGTTTIWDINGVSTLDFTIPFISATYWKANNLSTPNSLLCNLGTISVFAMQPLTGPSTVTPSAAIVAFLSVGDGYNVRGMRRPSLGLQPQVRDDLNAPTTTSSIEGGAPSSAPETRTTFEIRDAHRPPDTILQNYITFNRPIFDSGSEYSAQLSTGIQVRELNPVSGNLYAGSGDTRLLCILLFTYVRGDPRLAIRVSNPAAFTAHISFFFIPPGGAVPNSNFTNVQLADCYNVRAPVAPTKRETVCLSIPYANPLSAIPTSFMGFADFSGGTDVVNTTFGTLVITVEFQGTVDTSQYPTIYPSIAFGNFRAWVPRPPPSTASAPDSSAAAFADPRGTALEHYRLHAARHPQLPIALARRQCQDRETPSLLHPDSRIYIVQAQRPTYTHWALRAVHVDGTAEQISLSRSGVNCVIAYEDCEGELYQEVSPGCWVTAACLVGDPWDYSIDHNCTNFVSNITGVSLPNTGYSLAFGIFALSAVSIVAAQALRGRVAERQGDTSPSSSESFLSSTSQPHTRSLHNTIFSTSESDPPARPTRQTRRRRRAVQDSDSEDVSFFSTPRLIKDATASIRYAADTAKELELKATSNNLMLCSSDLREAAYKVSSSVDGFRDFLSTWTDSFKGSVGDAVSSGVATFLKWVAKAFGYLLVIFGSPTPMSLTGVLLLLCADLSPEIAGYFTQVPNAIGALYFWIANKLGLSVTPEECAQQGVEAQGLGDYNTFANAVKNTEYLASKAWEWTAKLMDWIQGKVKTDPNLQLANAHDEILRFYRESIEALSAAPPNAPAAADAISRLQELAKIAADPKSGPHSTYIQQSIKNFTSVLTKAGKRYTGNRPETISLYLTGPPACGKSLPSSILSSVLAKQLGGSVDDVYAPSDPQFEFYDGYTGQSVHFIDDIGQDPEGKDWKNFPNLVCSAPFILPMASIEEKGTYYTSRVIVATSNFDRANDRAARCMPAIERRLHLRLHVKARGGKIDPQKVLANTSLPNTSKYLTSHCSFSDLSCYEITIDRASIHKPADEAFKTFDELVDFILSRTQSNSKVSDLVRSVVSGRGATERTITREPQHAPYHTVIHDLLTSSHVSVPADLGRAIQANQPLSICDRIWQYRRPIFACTTFLSAVSFIGTLLYMAVRLWRARNEPEEGVEQGAYSGLPHLARKGKQQRPTPKPRPAVGPVQRQGCVTPAMPNIHRNVLPVVGVTPEENRSASALVLFSRFVLIPTHIVAGATHIRLGNDTFDTATLPNPLDLGPELQLWCFPTLRQFKDMRRFIGLHPHKTGCLLSACGNNYTYVRFSNCHRGPLAVGGQHIMDGAYVYNAATFRGLCGAPLVTDDPAGTSILGIHVAGVPGCTGFSIPLHPFTEEIAAYASQHQSLILNRVNLKFLGLPGVNINRKTRLRPSPAYGAFPIKKEPAPLKRSDPRLEEGIDLDAQLFLKHDKGDQFKPWPCFEEALALYTSTLPSSFRTLTQEEAIHGTPSMEGLDMNQAAGYPWNTMGRSRRSLFDEPTPGVYVPKPELQVMIDRCLEDPEYIYSTFLKDELRPIDKVKKGLTRAVECAPIHAVIAGRMLLGGIIEHYQANPGEYGSAVGCNPDYHWTPFFYKFAKYENVWDLDYKCFDATIPSVLLGAYADWVGRVTGDDRARRYVESIRFSHHVYGSELYDMLGGNPSGCVGTSIMNSWCNNVAVLSALLYCSGSDFNPRDYEILCYGDDVLYACEPNVHPRDIKAFYDKYTTFIVTPASKTADFPDSSSIYDVTFLKRWFVPDDIRGAYIHPVMQPDTYEQSVMWMKDGDFQCIVDSLSYLAFHSGPKTYAAWCQRVGDQCRLSGVDVHFLPYEFLQAKWVNLVSA
nr:polyprotein [Caprine kobuvirus]